MIAGPIELSFNMTALLITVSSGNGAACLRYRRNLNKR